MGRVLLAFCLFLFVLANSTSRVEAQSSHLDALWIDLGLGPPLIDLFNEFARPDDIARVNSVDQVDELDGITAGRKLVVFRSIEDVELALPRLADKFDIIGYNLEHGPATPLEEQADPVGSMRHLRQLADRYGMKLAVGPDHDFAVSHGASMAPYADIFVLQIQRVQTDRQTVHDFVLPLVAQLRFANPNLETSVQVRTEGDTGAIIDLLISLQEQLDGVSILTSPETVPIAEQLVADLRSPNIVPSGPVLNSPSPSGAATPEQPLSDPFVSGVKVGALGAFGLIAMCASAIVIFGLVLALLLLFAHYLSRRPTR